MSTLDRLSELCTALNKSNSSTAKLDVLRNFPDCQQLLKYTHDTILYQYGVTSKNIKKLEPKFAGKLSTLPFIDIESLLIALNNRQLTGHNAVMAVLGFIAFNPQHRELIFNILDRNLKTRTGITLINKVFPKLISEFDVALAESIQDYDPDRTKINFDTQVWYASRKMDGCLDYEASIFFEDGTIYKIGEVVEKRIEGKIKCFNIDTDKVEFCEIRNWMENGIDINPENNKHEWYEIETSDGKKITLTGNHLVYLPKLKCYRRVDQLDGTEELLID